MRKEITLVNIETNEKEVIAVDFKNVKKTNAIIAIIDLIFILTVDWWWSILVIILTGLFGTNNALNYNEAKDNLNILLNNGFIPETNIDKELIMKHFNFPESVLKPSMILEGDSIKEKEISSN